MLSRIAMISFLLIGLVSHLCAQTSQPASQPVEGLSTAAEAILDRLEKMVVRDVESPLMFRKYDPVLDSTEKHEGMLYFKRAEPNPAFLIHFDKTIHDGIVRNLKEWHAFDGRWYSEARESTLSIVKREIVRPGETLNVFELGKGPFPLPFGQKKSEILRHFTVQLAPPAKDDPANCDHLVCTPISGTDMARKYNTVHFYIHRTLDLPIRLTTVSKETDEEIQVDFPADRIKVNQNLPADKAAMPRLPQEYKITEERLSESDK